MALEESILNGIVTFGVLVASVSVYLYLEKRKYMQTKKIEVYSAMTSVLKKWYKALPKGGLNVQEREDHQEKIRKEAFQKISDLSEELLFYGSKEIYLGIRNLFKPIEGGTRIHVSEIKNLIIDMIKEIDKNREIKPKDIYFIDENEISS